MWKTVGNNLIKKIFNTKNNILLLAVILFFGCSKPEAEKKLTHEHFITVVTSSYVPYTLASEILKGTATVSSIVPPATGAHHFEPSAQGIIDIQKAQFFFYISDRMEPWAKKVSGDKGIALAQFTDIPPSGDPHIWMDFSSTSRMAEGIAATIAKKYPSAEPALLKNTLNFQNEIDMLKRLYSKSLKVCESRKIFHIGHMAFGYIAKNYDLEFIPLIGATFDAEPSARDLAAMTKKIKENNIKYIFTEDAVNSKLADTLAKETGAEILKLYTIEFVTKEQYDNKMTYRQFMTKNLESLIKGLDCH